MTDLVERLNAGLKLLDSKLHTLTSASGCDHEWRPYAFHPNGGPASYYCPLCRVNRAPTATEIQKSSVPDQPTERVK